MADQTAIEWCDSTFNPWIGCTKVSPACDDCYAARSTPARTLVVAWGPDEQRRRTGDDNWKKPGQWQRQAAAFQAQHGRRRRVFCASLADWLDNAVPIQWLVDLLEVIRTTPDLDWLLLSKRIGNWSSRISEAIGFLDEQTPAAYPLPLRAWLCHWLDGDEAPRNVWIGCTVVNQAEADRDLRKLLRVPAVLRFLSVEPMLGHIELLQWLRSDCWYGSRPGPGGRGGVTCSDCGGLGHQCRWLHWVICGGESGPKARPMHPDWAARLRDECADAGVPFLFKQWGEWMPEAAMDHAMRMRDHGQFDALHVKLNGSTHSNAPDDHTPYDASDVRMVRVGKKAAGRLLDGRTHDEWPEVRHG